MKSPFPVVPVALAALLPLAVLADSRVQASTAAPLRARPDTSSPVLATATPGEIFFADHAEGVWTAVAPPDRISLWIHSDFVDGARVAAKTVQLRTSPSLSADVAGSLSRGAPVLQQGREGDWIKIAPPSSAHVYIETASLSPVAERTEPVREIPETPSYIPEPAPVAAAPVASPDYPQTPPPEAVEPAPLPTPAISASVPGGAAARPAPATTYPAPPVAAAAAPAPTPAPASSSPSPAPASSLAITPSVPAPDSPAPAPKPSVSHPAPPVAARPASSPAPSRPARPAAPPAEHVTPPSELRRPLAEPPARSPHTPAVAPSKPASAPPSSRPSPIVVDQALIDELNLVDTPNQGKAVQVEGELRLAPFTKGSPSRYRLLVHGPRTAQMLCHVHGRPADLRPYIGRTVSIRGKAFRVADSDMPVVVVGKLVPIDPDPDPDAEGFRF